MTVVSHHHSTPDVGNLTEAEALDLARAMPCPAWCNRQHEQEVRELEPGDWSPAESPHNANAGDVFLPGLVNSVDGRTMRTGGGGWDLTLVQWPLASEPTTGYDGPPLLHVDVLQPNDDRWQRKGNASVMLTSGEARVLAAQLLAAAERMDRV